MESVPLHSPDPLGYQQTLPHRGRFYPLGCAVDFSTNSLEVLESVQDRWAGHKPVFEKRPVAFSVIVSDEAAETQPPPPTFRGCGHLMTLAADAAHFGCCDLAASTIACWVAPVTVRAPSYLHYDYLDALLLLMLSEQHFTPIHAGCVAKGKSGILLSGRASAGKSCLSYACARAGWTLISDDAGYLIRDDPGERILGRPRFLRFEFSAERLFPELRGLLATEAAKGAKVAEVDSSILPGIDTATECRAEAIVFLERRDGMNATLTAVGEEEALTRILTELPLATPPTREAQVASLQRLLNKGAYRLQYEQLDDAVAKLESIVRRH